MSSEIVKIKEGFDFSEAQAEAKKSLAYYEEDLFIEVSEKLVETMERHGISRSELAQRMDVSPGYITKILRGHANLSLKSLAKLAFALNLKWTCLLIPKDTNVKVCGLSDDIDGSATIQSIYNTINMTEEKFESAFDDDTQDQEEPFKESDEEIYEVTYNGKQQQRVPA